MVAILPDRMQLKMSRQENFENAINKMLSAVFEANSDAKCFSKIVNAVLTELNESAIRWLTARRNP